MLTPLSNADLSRSVQEYQLTGPGIGVKKESTKSSSNKWTKTFYRDSLHCIGNFCATVLNIFSKEIISDNTKCLK